MNNRIIVIGGNRGIGAALAECFESIGRNVLTTARGKYIEGERKANFETSLDLSTGKGLDELKAETAGETATVIITAAEIGPNNNGLQFDVKRWSETLNTNVLGVLRVVNLLSSNLASNSIFICFSGGGVGGKNHQTNRAAYIVSKTALVSLVEEISHDLSESRQAIIAIAPGQFDTGFSSDLTKLQHRSSWKSIDVSQIVKLISHLENQEMKNVTGRLFAARWDLPLLASKKEFVGKIYNHDFGKLRRIDNDMFGILGE